MSEKYPVWMDVDTGTDDAFALLVLHQLDCAEIVGLSAVSGNTPLENSFRNTRSLKTLMKADYPVYRGASKPLFREPHYVPEVHGENGMGDVNLPLPEKEEPEKAAWDALCEAAVKYGGSLTLIATGPLTNIATAFLKYPKLPGLLKKILIMGGGTQEGNITPAAEFNMYADPDAAKIVFKAGAPIVLCPLDVTERVRLTQEELQEIKGYGNEAGPFLYEMLQKPLQYHLSIGNDGAELHDCFPVLYLACPELFDTEEAGVAVETKGGISLGKTVTDLYSDKQFDFRNALVALDVDREAFKKKLKELIRQMP